MFPNAPMLGMGGAPTQGMPPIALIMQMMMQQQQRQQQMKEMMAQKTAQQAPLPSSAPASQAAANGTPPGQMGMPSPDGGPPPTPMLGMGMPPMGQGGFFG